MSKKHRQRTRDDILAKRQADDERRAGTKPVELIKPSKVENPGTILYNPFRPRFRSPGGIILIRPNK